METVENLELYHHGIRGMKWGIRRYQNKDGTLTKAGQKRYNQEMERAKAESKVLANRKRTAAKLEKLNTLKKKNEDERAALDGKKSNGSDSEKKSSQKPISQMTDTELFNYKQRLQMENDAYILQKKASELNPPKEAATKRLIEKAGPMIADKLWNDVAKPSLNKYLESKFKTPPGELEALEKEARLWKAKASIAKDKKNYGDDVEKRQQAERRRAEEAKASKEKAEKTKNKSQKSDSSTSESYERYAARGKDIIGNGTSTFKGWNDPPSRDAVWDGQRYVDSLLQLEDKSGR